MKRKKHNNGVELKTPTFKAKLICSSSVTSRSTTRLTCMPASFNVCTASVWDASDMSTSFTWTKLNDGITYIYKYKKKKHKKGTQNKNNNKQQQKNKNI